MPNPIHSPRDSEAKRPELRQAAEFAKKGQYDRAIVTLKALLQSEPGNEIGLGLLASIYLQIGYNVKALEFYERLLQINAANPLARFQSGLARLNEGSAEAALETWKPLLEREDDFMAHFHSALALLQLGRTAEVVPLLMRARRTMPESHPLYPRMLDLVAAYSGEKAEHGE